MKWLSRCPPLAWFDAASAVRSENDSRMIATPSTISATSGDTTSSGWVIRRQPS